MIIALTEASKNTFWKVVKMTDPNLKNQLQKIGVDTGTYLMPLEHIEKTLPVRMRLVGQKKDILISPDMTIHMVVHSSDNQKTSLAEIPVGSSAHLEGVTGEDASLARDLEKLGIIVGVTDFKILRRLPPMLYFASNEDGKRIRLTEAMASKILGEMENETTQFSMAGHARNFKVQTLLGSQKNQAELSSLGVNIGGHLLLDHVEPCPCPARACGHQKTNIRLITKDNMQFYLSAQAAAHTYVVP